MNLPAPRKIINPERGRHKSIRARTGQLSSRRFVSPASVTPRVHSRNDVTRQVDNEVQNGVIYYVIIIIIVTPPCCRRCRRKITKLFLNNNLALMSNHTTQVRAFESDSVVIIKIIIIIATPFKSFNSFRRLAVIYGNSFNVLCVISTVSLFLFRFQSVVWKTLLFWCKNHRFTWYYFHFHFGFLFYRNKIIFNRIYGQFT